MSKNEQEGRQGNRSELRTFSLLKLCFFQSCTEAGSPSLGMGSSNLDSLNKGFVSF